MPARRFRLRPDAPLRRTALSAALCAAGALGLAFAAAPAHAAGGADPLWPCIQPKVPTLAAGQMWAGPTIEGINWHDDPKVAELVPILAARRTPMDEADSLINAFAADAGSGADKNKRLTMLFAGVFDEINTQRSRILAGIERYSKHQVDLSKRIKEESLELSRAKKAEKKAAAGKTDASAPDAKAATAPDGAAPSGAAAGGSSTASQGGNGQAGSTAELEKEVLWDTRIYDARHQAVSAVCESPVILEQRVFALARAIQNVMD
ncbi:hypothetical protein [Ancylobacter mangrovi]|uniref:hypothetical protein n=1 Tax=Ancylobacter mangrovi TaxID=2972472 RepID=UPI002162B4D4|nr:hypothetical protein [Ancylobacter mangrovi]MCS0504244.1 hypothetical protein [Ancylobacter mangrovi]